MEEVKPPTDHAEQSSGEEEIDVDSNPEVLIPLEKQRTLTNFEGRFP
jgi:hypothetical protein